ncbi:hypothetical protein NST63_16955 [Heyndrickxia sp. FSL W8-0496]|uniref:hypothetical protein n=1 Tax=Heyndrickxia TaxID=2837504 RepID=UPI0030F73AC4
MKQSKKTIFVLAIIFLFSIFSIKPAFAREAIQIDVEAGLNGNIKSGRGFPIFLTIKNNGEDFSGSLLVNFAPSYNAGGMKAIHVELPAGTTKKYTVAVPGLSEDIGYELTRNPIVHLYKGDWRKDNEVKVNGKRTFSPKFVQQDEKSVGILSENPDRLKELKSIPATAGNVEVYPLSKKLIPTDSLGLDLLDYIIVDEYALTQLDEKQQKSIHDWIEDGGVLIAGATPEGLDSFGLLKDNMPMGINSEKELTNLSFLAVNNEEKPNFSQLPIFIGNINEKAIVMTEVDSTPVIARKQIGKGEIIQTAFSLGDEPLSSWKNYNTWLGSLLSQSDSSHLQSIMQNNGMGFYDSFSYELVDINQLFESSQFSLGVILSVLAGYFIVIVPLLYIILRKLDRREHAWWLIPVISILFSLGIFLTGAKDRIASPQINQMASLEADGNGGLSGIYGATLMSNTSGDYTFIYPKGEFNGSPIDRHGAGSIESLSKQAVVENKLKTDQITFNNVEYWSTRSLLGFTHIKKAGQFQVHLSINNQKITGEIKNQFPYDFEEVYIWSGYRTYKLGKLSKGQSLTVNEKMLDSYLLAPIHNGNLSGYPSNVTKDEIFRLKKDRLQWIAGNLSERMNKDSLPVVYGITKSPVIEAELEKKKAKMRNLSLIYQPFEITGVINGPFTLNQNSIRTKTSVIKGNIYEENVGRGNEMMLEDGEYEINYYLPKQLISDRTDIEQLSLQIEPSNFVDYQLFDFTAKKYIPIDEKNKVTVFDKQIDRYYKNGTFKIKILKLGQGDPHVFLPNLTVKGEVRP